MNGNFLSPTSPFAKPTNANNKHHHGRVPHFSTPAGMLLPKDKQPPPMYGPRGSTIPPQFMNNGSGGKHHQRFNDNRGNPNHNFRGHRGGRGRGRGGRQNHNRNEHESHVQNYELQSKSEGTWCETCDRGFRNLEQLAEHQAQHQTCGIEGCTFTGHPAVVKKHFDMQHQNGLFEQIKKLESPEEIAKWREERRKRYPTKSNVEMRHQMQEEKMKRGEKLTDPNSRFGRKQDRRQIKSEPQTRQEPQSGCEPRSGKRKRNKRQKGNKAMEKPQIAEPVTEAAVEPDNIEDTNLPRFCGTRSMKNSWHINPDPEPTQKNALASLLDCYGSGSESEEEPPAPQSTCETKAVDASEVKVDSELEEGEISDSAETAEPKLEVAVSENPEEPAPDTRKRQRNRPKKADPGEQANKKPKLPQRPPRRTNTLLEKLLQPEIRHERNVLLQCVRYVVEQKMFGIGAENKKTIPTSELSTRPDSDPGGKEGKE